MNEVCALAALRAIAGHQNEALWHHLAKELTLLGIGCANHRADIAVGIAHALCAPLCHLLADDLIQGLTVHDAILELSAGRIGGLHQNEDTLLLFLTNLHEGLHAVASKVGIHGHEILIKAVERIRSHADLAEMSDRIRFRSGSNVAALDVADHDKSLFLTVVHSLLEGNQSGDPKLLIHGDLRLYGRHQVINGIHDALIILPDGFCRAL